MRRIRVAPLILYFRQQFALTAAATMELASGQTLAYVLLFGLDLLVVQVKKKKLNEPIFTSLFSMSTQ